MHIDVFFIIYVRCLMFYCLITSIGNIKNERSIV